MAIPFLPYSNSAIHSDDQEAIERGYTNGLYCGKREISLLSNRYDYSAIMTNLSQERGISVKVFYAKTDAQDQPFYNGELALYFLSNIQDNEHDLLYIERRPDENPFTPSYYYYMNMETMNIQFPSPTILGNYLYWRGPYRIDIAESNPMIPIFDTFTEGYNEADIEGWYWHNPDNPYEFDDEAISYAGGGAGSFDNTSDTVGVPSLPTLSAVSAGFIAMYSPTLTQLNQLASFLWTDSMFDPDNFKKLFSDPMECIIGLTIVPVNPQTAGSMSVKVGYVDTGISMPRLSSQYAEVNCGTIQAQEFWGSALDYSPMTRLHLYLPYVGIREISADEVMNKSIGVKYHIDLLSGALTAFVTANGSVLYQFNGQCALNVPMASSNFTHMIQGAITSIGSVASTVATGGASVGAGMALTATQLGASAANNAISNKPSFSHSGSMGGSGGMLGVQTPYLIIERPRQSMPEGMNKFCGFPSNINYKLYNLEGYTQVEYIHLENIPATGAELDEIEGLLRTGVIL